MQGADEDKVQGTADDVKGKAKETIGGLTGDRQTEAEGKGDQAKGGVEKAKGDVKDAIDDITR